MAGRVDLIPGVDFSAWQVGVNFQTRIPWAQFIYIKVSEGVGNAFRQDTLFASAVAASIPHKGPYHFARPAARGLAGADLEADVFLAEWDRFAWDFPPSLDIEAPESSLGGMDSEWCIRWGRRVRDHTGRRPVLYSYYGYIVDNLMGDSRLPEMFDLWIGAPDYVPFDRPSNNIPPWTRETIWQHTVDDIDNDVITTEAYSRLAPNPIAIPKEDRMPCAVYQTDGAAKGTIWLVGETKRPIQGSWETVKNGVNALLQANVLSSYTQATEAALAIIPDYQAPVAPPAVTVPVEALAQRTAAILQPYLTPASGADPDKVAAEVLDAIFTKLGGLFHT